MCKHVFKTLFNKKYEMQPTWMENTIMWNAFMLFRCCVFVEESFWNVLRYWLQCFGNFIDCLDVFIHFLRAWRFVEIFFMISNFFLVCHAPNISLNFFLDFQKLRDIFVVYKNEETTLPTTSTMKYNSNGFESSVSGGGH